MAIYGYTKNYKLIKPQYDTDTWHDYEYDNLDTIDAVLSAIYASGNWKGFWATNTAYVVGDVVIDRDTDTMYKVMVEHTTSEATFAAEWTAHPDYYELWSPNNLAESWATKTDDKVSNEDYSAKAYAISSGLINDGSAKEWAIGSGAVGNTNEYSAKKYATDAHNDYISMTTNPNVAAVSSNINNVNAVGQSISDVNTVASNVSSVNTVAGVSTDVTAVASIASSVPTVADNNANITTVATNISDVNTAASNMAAIQNAPTAATNAANSATASANSATASANSAQAAQDALNDVHGLIATPIGTIFQSVYVDESLDIARQLNGQLISSTKFTGFRSWLNTVQTATPNLFTTETNWQAEKTNSKLGQCGKFVIDDTAGTIRLPCVVNAQGLVDLALIGGIKSESLPNIKGETPINAGYDASNITGAFLSSKSNKFGYSFTGSNNDTNTKFDASNYSSTYQDNAPVQQEAVQYPYYIQVATGVEETLPAIREYNINTPFFFGQSMYSDVVPSNASWLASKGQWNAKSVYPDYYDWLLEQMNAGVSGFVASTAAYTDYDFVINTTNQTFRLPLLNGEEDLPSDRKTSITIGASGSSEIAPANGFYCLHASNNTSSLEIYVGTSTNFTLHATTRDDAGWNGVFVNVSKGDRIEYYYAGTGTPNVFQFIYAKGNGTLYYYVGDTVQDASLINAGAVLGQLSNKADINASNFNAAGKSLLSGLGMPSGRYIDLTLLASGSGYTAPANGWFSAYCATGLSTSCYLLNNTKGINAVGAVVGGLTDGRCHIPANKGDVINFFYNGMDLSKGGFLRFIYAEGEN